MTLNAHPNPGPAARVARCCLCIGLVALGAWLIVRPLTSLTALLATVAVAGAVLAVALVARNRAGFWGWVAAAPPAAVAAAVPASPTRAGAMLPEALAVALGVRAARRGPALRRVSAGLGGLAAAGGAVLAWAWPDPLALALANDQPLYRFDVDSGAVNARLRENVATATFTAPLFLGQGADDEVIPVSMQRALAAQRRASGLPLEAHEYPGLTHMGVVAADSPLIDDLYAWADRILAD